MHTLRPFAPDDRGESDFEYFFSRKNVFERLRLPFPDEYEPDVLEPGRSAFVRIRIERDAFDLPKRRAKRHLFFCYGGRA
jgi:hypothetical protein